MSTVSTHMYIRTKSGNAVRYTVLRNMLRLHIFSCILAGTGRCGFSQFAHEPRAVLDHQNTSCFYEVLQVTCSCSVVGEKGWRRRALTSAAQLDGGVPPRLQEK